jgi:hypothetical protein
MITYASPEGTCDAVHMVEKYQRRTPAGSLGGLSSFCHFGCNSVQIARLSSKQAALPSLVSSTKSSYQWDWTALRVVERKIRVSILPRNAKTTHHQL